MRIVLVLLFIAVTSAVSGETDWAAIKAGRVKASITIRAVDETGAGLTGAMVRVCFRHVDDHMQGSSAGESDTNGLFFAEGSPYWGDVSYSVSEEGHYRTEGEYHFFNTEIKAMRWQPWNPTVTVIVKRIVNPSPMYAKTVNLGMPTFDTPAGFDLQVGDWVAPHGEGVIPDLVFTANLEKKSDQEYSYNLVVSFSNPGDGIQPFEVPCNSGSLLKSPHEAPTSGYEKQWIQTRIRDSKTGEVGNLDMTRNYFLRVRTTVDEYGKITSALYGKIYGDFLHFTYYLNPDGTRNMEFDPKKNLLTGIESFESPNAP